MQSKKIFHKFIEIFVGKYICFFKLQTGEDCFGEVELINHEQCFKYYPVFDNELLDSDYQKYYCEDDEELDKTIDFILIPFEYVDTNNLYYWEKQSSSYIHTSWNDEQECWIYNETKPGSIPRNNPHISKQTNDHKYLKMVGYWQSDEYQPYFPHPKYLVDKKWRESEQSKIITYLKSGHKCGHWMGFSYCRFGCFNPKNFIKVEMTELEECELMDGIESMGYRDFTDGEWIWPEGLFHYVEKHNICLPDDFITTMQKNSWLVPTNIPTNLYGFTSEYWINWSIKYCYHKEKY